MRLALVALLFAAGCDGACNQGDLGRGRALAGMARGVYGEAAGCSLAEEPALNFRASDAVCSGGACSNTDPVDSLPDQGVHGYDVANTSTSRPTYVASDAILGVPVLDFDRASGQHLDSASTFTSAGFPVLGCALVFSDGSGGNASPFSFGGRSGTDAYIYENITNARFIASSAAPVISSVYNATEWHVHCGHTPGASGNVTIYFDGAEATAAVNGTPTIDAARLGQNEPESMAFEGRIAAWLMFEATALTGADVQAYWECMYGVDFPAS